MRLLILLIAATLAFAQDKPAEPKPESYEAVIIPVKTLTGDSFDRLMTLLAVFGAQYRGDSQLHTILVYAPKEKVDAMRKVIEQLDRPGSEAAIGRNIEMTMTFLRCSVKPGQTPGTVPSDLEPVARQLRAATQYKDIALWDVVPLRLQEGKTTSESLRLPSLSQVTGQAPLAQIKIHPEAIGVKNGGKYIRFSEVAVSMKVPIPTGSFAGGGVNPLANTQFSYVDMSVNTAGDFFEGQKTVLGKVSGQDDESAIFVVIALKILD